MGTVFELELLFNGSVPVDEVLAIEKQDIDITIPFMGRNYSIIDVEFGSGISATIIDSTLCEHLY